MKKSGFTLLEVLIGMVLFTFGVVLMLGFFTNSLVGSADAENTTIAMNLAQKRMEEIRNLAFVAIAGEPRDGVDGFSGFEMKVEVDDPAGDPAIGDLKEVTVTVYWDYKGRQVSVELVTYISRT